MKKNKKLALVLLSGACGLACLTGFGVSYAWIKRVWEPSFVYEDLKVETNESLTIKIEDIGDEGKYPKIDLNKDVIKLTSFVLNQTSNSSGESDDFFGIDYAEGDGKEKLKLLVPENERNPNYTQIGIDNGYIDVKFTIASSSSSETIGKKRFFFIDNFKSYINSDIYEGKDPSEALRMSLTIIGDGSTEDSTKVFRKTFYTRTEGVIDPTGPLNYHLGATDEVDIDNHHIADKGYVYKQGTSTQEYNPDVIKENRLNTYEFIDYNGGFPGYDPQTGLPIGEWELDQSKTLFALNPNEKRSIRLRLWLEGFDDNTKDQIAGSELDFKLVLRAHDVITTPEEPIEE